MDQSMQSSRLRIIQNWKDSEEYQILQKTLHAEALQIYQFVIAHVDSYRKVIPSRTEIGSKSDLHRGFYCPSPVQDAVIGNVKRGKLLKRLSKRSSTYYVYGFDENDRLVWIDHYYNGSLINTEYLLYKNECIYGVKVENDGRITQVTFEKYQGQRIVSYWNVQVLSSRERDPITQMRKEVYDYNQWGLSQCIITEFINEAPLLNELLFSSMAKKGLFCTQRIYHFKCKDDMLESYSVSDVIGCEPHADLNRSSEYDVLVTRKADLVGFPFT